jgi:hypothetical protein
VVVVLATAGAAGCAGSGEDEESRAAQVYVAAIRDVISDQPPPPDPDDPPVVYVVALGEHEIGADVQAEVASELHDDADVRFADERSEAVLEDEDGVPVRDHGVLVGVSEVPGEGDPVAVEVEVYRSDADRSMRVLTVERTSSQWTVTSSSVLPADDA